MSAAMDGLFIREFERNDHKTLSIFQKYIGDVGCVVWDAALVLSSYIESTPLKLNQKLVVELGAGTGIVGIQAACCGANVFLTDLEEFVPLMNLNIENNISNITGSCNSAALKWGTTVPDNLRHPDIVLMADCIYYEESLSPLVETITSLCKKSTVVYCCYEERTSGDKPRLLKEFKQLVQQHFLVTEIPVSEHDERFRCDEIHILKFEPL